MRKLRMRRSTARQRNRRITTRRLHITKLRRIRFLKCVNINIRIILHLTKTQCIQVLKRLLRSSNTMIQTCLTLLVTNVQISQRRTNRSLANKLTDQGMNKNRQRRQFLNTANLRNRMMQQLRSILILLKLKFNQVSQHLPRIFT